MKNLSNIRHLSLATALALVLTQSALASDIGLAGTITPDSLVKSLYPGKGYSPYANRDFPSNVYRCVS